MITTFHTFSTQHFGILFSLGIATYWVIRKGLKSDFMEKLRIGLIIAGFTFSTQLIEIIHILFTRSFDFRQDLPLYLCDIATLLLPWVLWTRKRTWIGVLYFWALGGTIQALITPDLDAGFPSFDFFRYFIMHGGIVAAVLYTVVVFRIRINWKDFLNAVIYTQVYLVLIHLTNQLLSSNYCYTMQKPADPTLLDYLGPWPWYIFWGEFLMLILFLLLLLPFLRQRKSMQEQGRMDEVFDSD